MLTLSRWTTLAATLATITVLAGCAQTAPATHTANTAAATSPAKPPPPLVGTHWRLKELDGQRITRTPPQQRDITIMFNDGRVSGNSGCNQMMSSYGTNGHNTLALTQIAGTMMACEPADMALEQQLLKRLASINGYRYDGQDLLLTNEGVAVLRYAVAPQN